MLRTIGIKGSIENLLLLSRPYASDKDISFSGLKRAYKKFLFHVQPTVPTSSHDSVELLRDVHRTKTLISLFAEKSRLDDFDHIFSNEAQFEAHLEQVELHLQKLKEIDDQLYSLFSLVINILFSGPSKLANGGSSSGAIGCIWINSRPTWNSQDFLEFFIHEMTHNLIFLDEYRYHHYTDYSGMFLEENYTTSAILAKRRPLDKVFHSILVSTEVLLSRRDILGNPEFPSLHPPTSIMLNKTIEAIDSIENNQNIHILLTPRGKELIRVCKEHLKEICPILSLPSSRELAAVSDFNDAAFASNLIY